MFWISILKRENRRAGKDRKNSNNKSDTPEGISPKERRAVNDRRSDVGRRTGLYYRLPDNQKGTVDTIIDILEKRLEK